jgi:hypothetical protein
MAELITAVPRQRRRLLKTAYPGDVVKLEVVA